MPLYLYLLLFTITGPLIRSFEGRVKFYSKFHALFAAVIVVGLPFIIWDIMFTEWAYWGFNPTYLLGWEVAGLPVEEWAFFVIIPYTCIFCYEIFDYFLGDRWAVPYPRIISGIVAVILLIVGMANSERAYTSWTGVSTAVILGAIVVQNPAWLGKFWRMYLVIIIPFLIVNGGLTGSFTAEPVVWYSDAQNLAIRAGTIPIEDFAYNLLLLLANVYVYEMVRSRWPVWP